ncbi:hypothetical protein SAMN05428979_0504 [Stappia sp. ES.058]|nr:hypothetical protein SAMN05428979_0504 [Stappia sp. ES.058]
MTRVATRARLRPLIARFDIIYGYYCDFLQYIAVIMK